MMELFGLSANSKQVAVPLSAIDQANETWLESTPLDSAAEESTEVEPTRIDRTIVLTDAENTKRMKVDADFLAAIAQARTEDDRLKSYQEQRNAYSQIRQEAVSRNIPADAQGKTLIYGPHFVNGSTIAADGIFRTCSTLIHATHPVSPEDEYLREAQVQCDRIVRYRVLGIDDGQWQLINQPLHWPMTAEDWRQMLLARDRQEI